MFDDRLTESVERRDEYPSNVRAREWVEKMEEEEKTPNQVVGDLIANGVKVVSYVGTRDQGWNPEAVDTGEGRRMVFFAGKKIAVPRYGAETIRAGLKYGLEVDRSNTFSTDALVMVPYPRFDETGKVLISSLVLVLTKSQVDELAQIVGK
jgi:hypothetical protein